MQKRDRKWSLAKERSLLTEEGWIQKTIYLASAGWGNSRSESRLLGCQSRLLSVWESLLRLWESLLGRQSRLLWCKSR